MFIQWLQTCLLPFEALDIFQEGTYVFMSSLSIIFPQGVHCQETCKSFNFMFLKK